RIQEEEERGKKRLTTRGNRSIFSLASSPLVVVHVANRGACGLLLYSVRHYRGCPRSCCGGALCLLAPPRCANARWPSLEGCSPYRVARPRVSSVFSVELNSYS
ncbi:unnamed protein product, partial [Pylaiella littoralis]